MPCYAYHINLDERGEFYADMRDINDESVWEVHTDEAHELVEDGFISDIRDGCQVLDYLVREARLLPIEANLVSKNEMARRQQVFERLKPKPPGVESLYGPHVVVVSASIERGVDENKLHPDDQANLKDILGPHTFMVSDIERLVADFDESRFEEAALGTPKARAEFILEQTALDRFHEQFPVKMLEDFEFHADPSEAAVKEVLRLRSATNELEGPSL